MASGYKITVGGNTFNLEDIYDTTGTAVTVGTPNFKTGGTSGILTAAAPDILENNGIQYNNFKSDQNPLTNFYKISGTGIGSGAATSGYIENDNLSREQLHDVQTAVPGWAQSFSCYLLSASGVQGAQGHQAHAHKCPTAGKKRNRPGGAGGFGGKPALVYTTSAISLQSGYSNVDVSGIPNGIKITHGNISIQANNGAQGATGNSGNTSCRKGNAGNQGAQGAAGNLSGNVSATDISFVNVSAVNGSKKYKVLFLI